LSSERVDTDGRDRGFPRADREARRRARGLPHGHTRAGAAGRRRRGRTLPGWEAARPARRRAARLQGRPLHTRGHDHLRLQDARGLRAAIRRDRHRAPHRRGGGDARQGEHGRVRAGVLRRTLGVQADPPAGTCRTTPAPDYAAPLAPGLQGLRLGLPDEYFIEGMDAEVEHTVRTAVDVRRGLGATVERISLPATPHALATYYVIAPAEA